MIKKVILAILIALPVSALAQKFGVVDIETLITNMPEYTAMQSTLNEAAKKYEDEYGKLQEEFNKKFTEYQELDKDTTTPQSIKDRRLEEIQDLDQKAQQFRATAQQDLQRQQQQLMAPIEQKIQDAIKSVGQEGGYTFIFQKQSALYEGTDVVDVTSAVQAKVTTK